MQNQADLLIDRLVYDAIFDLGYYVFDLGAGWLLIVMSPTIGLDEETIQQFVGTKIVSVREEERMIEVRFSEDNSFKVNLCRSVQPDACESMVLRTPNHANYSWDCKDPL